MCADFTYILFGLFFSTRWLIQYFREKSAVICSFLSPDDEALLSSASADCELSFTRLCFELYKTAYQAPISSTPSNYVFVNG